MEVGIDDLGARAIGDPGGEQSSSVGDLGGENREHRSRIMASTASIALALK